MVSALILSLVALVAVWRVAVAVGMVRGVAMLAFNADNAFDDVSWFRRAFLALVIAFGPFVPIGVCGLLLRAFRPKESQERLHALVRELMIGLLLKKSAAVAS